MLFVSRKRVRAFTAALLPLCKVDPAAQEFRHMTVTARAAATAPRKFFFPASWGAWGGPRRCEPNRCGGPRARSTLSLVILTLRT